MQIELMLVENGEEQPLIVDLPAVPRSGEMIKVGSRNYKAQLVQWCLPIDETGTLATIWLEPRP